MYNDVSDPFFHAAGLFNKQPEDITSVIVSTQGTCGPRPLKDCIDDCNFADPSQSQIAGCIVSLLSLTTTNALTNHDNSLRMTGKEGRTGNVYMDTQIPYEPLQFVARTIASALDQGIEWIRDMVDSSNRRSKCINLGRLAMDWHIDDIND